MTQFGHIYSRLDGPEYVALVRSIATDGIEAGYSEAAVADARRRLNEIVKTKTRRLRVTPGYTSGNDATLEVSLVDDEGGDTEILADYTLRYDAGLNEVVLVKRHPATADEDEIVYFGGRLPLGSGVERPVQ